LENLPVSAASVAQHGNFCERKVIILTANTASAARKREHAIIAGRLPLGEHILAEESNHWIMQKDSDLVIGAVKKVVTHFRESLEQSVASTAGSGK
jgi:hypothetical protein